MREEEKGILLLWDDGHVCGVVVAGTQAVITLPHILYSLVTFFLQKKEDAWRGMEDGRCEVS